MEVKILTKDQLEDYIKTEHTENALVIVIRDSDALPNPFLINNVANGISFILPLSFDDIEHDISGKSISEKDAKKLARAVKHSADADVIIISCHPGLSRSVGIAAAIMDYYGDDIAPLMENYKAMNASCYKYTKFALESVLVRTPQKREA